MMNPSIFRAYDIRGVYGKDFTDADFERIGNAFSRFAKHIIIVGRDSRNSSPNLKAALIKGLASTGLDVMDVGMTPRGATMFWGFRNKLPSLYITASHLPAEWNGLKFTYSDGTGFSEKDSAKIREAVLSGCKGIKASEVPGMVEQTPVLNEYKRFLKEKIPVMDREIKVLLDCGNGTAGLAAPDAFSEHGCEVSTLFLEPDGNFPNRQSEIKEEMLAEAKKMAKDYDIMVAFDGDAGGLALIDNKGRVLSSEAVSCLVLSELLKNEKGVVVSGIETGKVLAGLLDELGRGVVRPIRPADGGALKMLKSSPCFRIEDETHFIIPSIINAEDGIAAGLYAAYALSKKDITLADFVDSISTG